MRDAKGACTAKGTSGGLFESRKIPIVDLFTEIVQLARASRSSAFQPWNGRYIVSGMRMTGHPVKISNSQPNSLLNNERACRRDQNVDKLKSVRCLWPVGKSWAVSSGG